MIEQSFFIKFCKMLNTFMHHMYQRYFYTTWRKSKAILNSMNTFNSVYPYFIHILAIAIDRKQKKQFIHILAMNRQQKKLHPPRVCLLIMLFPLSNVNLLAY